MASIHLPVEILADNQKLQRKNPMIQPLLGQGTLYHINRNRDRWLTEIERRKALGYCIKILLVIAIGIVCWHFHPTPSFDKGEPVAQTEQGDR